MNFVFRESYPSIRRSGLFSVSFIRGFSFAIFTVFAVFIFGISSVQNVNADSITSENSVSTNANNDDANNTNSAENNWIREFWFDVFGTNEGAIKNHLLTSADETEIVTNGNDFSENVGDYYLSRTRGYIVPEKTGVYRFATINADEVELWLSTDSTMGQKKRIINAGISTDWTPSGEVILTAGKTYFIEILHHEWSGADFLQVAWQAPDSAEFTAIPQSVMRPYFSPSDDPLCFGYPQSWIESSGLSTLSPSQQAPWADPFNTGLTNLQRYFFSQNFPNSTNLFDKNNNGQIDLHETFGRVEYSGSFLREIWRNISGSHISQFLSATENFRKLPNEISLHNSAQITTDFADNYGQRLRGFITIPTSGVYHFFIAGDDVVELSIGLDGTKWNRERAAYAKTFTNVAQWNRFPTQKSRAYNLTAGQKIFVEILHKESTNNDHVQLAWTTPFSDFPSVVPSTFISSYVFDANDFDDDDLPDDWEIANGLDNHDNGVENALNGNAGIRNNVGLTNLQCSRLGLNPNAPDIEDILGKISVQGSLQREYWAGISGASVESLKNAAKFTLPADEKTFVQPFGFSIGNSAENSGERWRGWIKVSESGQYQLGIHADAAAELWISSDSTPLKKRQIATVKNSTESYEFKFPEQKTMPLFLESGQRYYVEILYKKASGEGRCQLSWTTPENSNWVSIPNNFFYSWVDDAALDRNDFSLSWLAENNFAPGSVSQNGFSNQTSFLNNWQSYRLATSGNATGNAENAEENSSARAWIREFWFNATGNCMEDFLQKFLTPADRREVVLGGDDFSSQIGDTYLTRTRGYIVAPKTGAYRFAINSDDEAELWLSTDASPAAARRIISTPFTAWNTWTNAAQQSSQILLENGTKYYVEIRHREGGNSDFLRIAWQTPGANNLEFIPAAVMRPYIPSAADPLGFGYPQTWLESTGLSTLPLAQQAPWADVTGDGITNIEKFRYGLNPLSTDSDNDGISDSEELRQVGSNPALADFDGSHNILFSINGSAFNQPTPQLTPQPSPTGTLGSWQINGNSVYAADTRGTLEYDVTLSETGTYRLIVTGGQYFSNSANRVFPLEVYADNFYVGNATLRVPENASPQAETTAAIWLPQLSTGSHKIRLVWLNTAVENSLRIDRLEIENRGGTWLSTRQNTLSFVDSTTQASYTSPYCLEGRTLNASLFQIATSYIPNENATDYYSVFTCQKFFSNNNANLSALPALKNQFYSDVPLSPVSSTQLSWTDFNTNAQGTKTILWQPYILGEHDAEEFYLRQGNSLLLQSTSSITIIHPDNTQEILHVSNGNPETANSPVAPIPFVFSASGTYQITTENTSLTVHSVSTNLSPAPTTILGQPRDWTPPRYSPEAVLYHDDSLSVTKTTPKNGSPTFTLQSFTTAPQQIIARLFDSGPILSSTSVNTLLNTTRAPTTLDIIQVFDDGTLMWKGTLSFGGNIPENFRVKLTMYKAGSTFDDGSNIRWITAQDLDANGTYTYYMLLPENVVGSSCHSALYYVGDELISTNL